MGVIEHVTSGRRFTLGARCLVGRAPHCGIEENQALTSAEHAVIQWRTGQWTVRDLGSSNGTKLDGAALKPGQRQPLRLDAEVVFGSPAARWRLVEASPPMARAVQQDGDIVCLEEDGLLALPAADAPEACLYRDDEDHWWVEVDGPARRGTDQEVLSLDSGQWRLELPSPAGRTSLPTTRKLGDEPSLLDEAELRFTVSRDEEHVELSVVDGDRVYDLGARAHHYLLLTLARARQKDAAAAEAEDEDEQGWLYADELANAISVELTQLNLHVYRARRQLAKAGLLNAGKIVDRRAGSRQIRLGPPRIRIDGAG